MKYSQQELEQRIKKLPVYTEREERVNIITHMIGAVIGVIGFVIMLTLAIIKTTKDIMNFIDIDRKSVV